MRPDDALRTGYWERQIANQVLFWSDSSPREERTIRIARFGLALCRVCVVLLGLAEIAFLSALLFFFIR